MSEEKIRIFIKNDVMMPRTYEKRLNLVRKCLLKDGRYWKGSKELELTPHGRLINDYQYRRRVGNCYSIVSSISIRSKLDYVEGIGYSSMDVWPAVDTNVGACFNHAWLTDGEDVYDPTWTGGFVGDGKELLYNLEECSYFGIVVDKKYVIQFLDEALMVRVPSTPLMLMVMDKEHRRLKSNE